jgi:hypothetical protein
MQTTDRKLSWVLGIVVVIAAAVCPRAVAQTSQTPALPSSIPATGNLPMPGDVAGVHPTYNSERLETDRNLDRQRRLVADTDKLLVLATQLKTEVDKTNAHILSIEVVKKAEEIEKLAKSVKDRMKG